MDKVTICNLALGHLGADTISDITEQTTQAISCSLYYDIALGATLEAVDWSFARKERALALLTDEAENFTNWSYAYSYPADCVKALYIPIETVRNPQLESRIKFEISLRSDDAAKVILTDMGNAKLVYTARITNPNMFSSLFVEAFSYKLAGLLAFPVIRKSSVSQAMNQAAEYLMGQAAARNYNEGQRDDRPESTLVTARR